MAPAPTPVLSVPRAASGKATSRQWPSLAEQKPTRRQRALSLRRQLLEFKDRLVSHQHTLLDEDYFDTACSLDLANGTTVGDERESFNQDWYTVADLWAHDGPYAGWNEVRRLCCVSPAGAGTSLQSGSRGPSADAQNRPKKRRGFVHFDMGRLQVGTSRWLRSFDVDALYLQASEMAARLSSWHSRCPEGRPSALSLVTFGTQACWNCARLLQALPASMWCLSTYVSGFFLEAGGSVLRDIWDVQHRVVAPLQSDLCQRPCADAQDAHTLIRSLEELLNKYKVAALLLTYSWVSLPGRLIIAGVEPSMERRLGIWLRPPATKDSRPAQQPAHSPGALEVLFARCEASFAGAPPDMWLMGYIKGDPDCDDVRTLQQLVEAERAPLNMPQQPTAQPLQQAWPKGAITSDSIGMHPRMLEVSGSTADVAPAPPCSLNRLDLPAARCLAAMTLSSSPLPPTAGNLSNTSLAPRNGLSTASGHSLYRLDSTSVSDVEWSHGHQSGATLSASTSLSTWKISSATEARGVFDAPTHSPDDVLAVAEEQPEFAGIVRELATPPGFSNLNGGRLAGTSLLDPEEQIQVDSVAATIDTSLSVVRETSSGNVGHVLPGTLDTLQNRIEALRARAALTSRSSSRSASLNSRTPSIEAMTFAASPSKAVLARVESSAALTPIVDGSCRDSTSTPPMDHRRESSDKLPPSDGGVVVEVLRMDGKASATTGTAPSLEIPQGADALEAGKKPSKQEFLDFFDERSRILPPSRANEAVEAWKIGKDLARRELAEKEDIEKCSEELPSASRQQNRASDENHTGAPVSAEPKALELLSPSVMSESALRDQKRWQRILFRESARYQAAEAADAAEQAWKAGKEQARRELQDKSNTEVEAASVQLSAPGTKAAVALSSKAETADTSPERRLWIQHQELSGALGDFVSMCKEMSKVEIME